jgi:hypothetical protein
LEVDERQAVAEEGKCGTGDSGTTSSHRVNKVEALEGIEEQKNRQDEERRPQDRQHDQPHFLQQRGAVNSRLFVQLPRDVE